MSELIKIAVDAMGGDNSPKKIIDGIIHNHKSNHENFFHIFGNEKEIFPYLTGKIDKNFFEITHTENVVKINPSVLNIIGNLYQDEIDETIKNNKISISFEADAVIENAKIEIIKDVKQKSQKKKATKEKTKKLENKTNKNKIKQNKEKRDRKAQKSKIEKPINPIKEIKNKKTGWWQT